MTTKTPTNILEIKNGVTEVSPTDLSMNRVHMVAKLAMLALAINVGDATAQESTKQNTTPEGNREKPGAVVTITFQTPSPSATLQETKGQEHGQTNSITLKDGRKLSFSDIQAEKDPEVKKGILNGMERSDKILFKEWEAQMAITTNKSKLEMKEVAIKETSEKIVRFAQNIKTMLDDNKKLDNETKEGIIQFIAFGKPPETIKYLQTVLSNSKNFV